MVDSGPSVITKAISKASTMARATLLCARPGDRVERMKCCSSGTTATARPTSTEASRPLKRLGGDVSCGGECDRAGDHLRAPFSLHRSGSSGEIWTLNLTSIYLVCAWRSMSRRLIDAETD